VKLHGSCPKTCTEAFGGAMSGTGCVVWELPEKCQIVVPWSVRLLKSRIVTLLAKSTGRVLVNVPVSASIVPFTSESAVITTLPVGDPIPPTPVISPRVSWPGVVISMVVFARIPLTKFRVARLWIATADTVRPSAVVVSCSLRKTLPGVPVTIAATVVTSVSSGWLLEVPILVAASMTRTLPVISPFVPCSIEPFSAPSDTWPVPAFN
jgi:hypothetical protein